MVIGNGPFRCSAVANKMRRGLINGAINREDKHPNQGFTEQRQKIPKRTSMDWRSSILCAEAQSARASTLGKVPFFGSFFGHAKNEQTICQAQNLFHLKRFGHLLIHIKIGHL
jgi:hypothetical protein